MGSLYTLLEVHCVTVQYKCLLNPFQRSQSVSILYKMGSQQSSRRITEVSDEASGVIKISDSVVNRLKEEIEGANNNQQNREENARPSNDPPPPQTQPPTIPEVEKPQTVVPEPIPPAPEPKVAEPIVQELRAQRPIIHYVEEPSLSSLRIRAEKEKELN